MTQKQQTTIDKHLDMAGKLCHGIATHHCGRRMNGRQHRRYKHHISEAERIRLRAEKNPLLDVDNLPI